jgi:tetratricopeptide (TPR) repeat protein
MQTRTELSGNVKMKTGKVLIVEDFFSFRMTIKNMLRSFGFISIDEAADGEEALKRMVIRKFDIILCDYNLGPGKSGQQVLEEAKHLGYINHSTIFIMVTAENSLEMIMAAAEFQPDDYMIKPFAKEALKKKITNAQMKKENIREIEEAIKDGEYEQAIQKCNELIEQTPRNLFELMKLKGGILLKKGAYQEAAELYNKVMEMGNVAWAQLGRGRADFMLGNYAQAKEAFENVIAQNDKIMATYDYLVRTLTKMGKFKEAQQVLMKAVSISPRALHRQKNLGEISYRNQDFSTAESSFKAAVEQGKNSCFKSVSDYTNLAKAIVHGDAPEKSLSVLNDALQEFPDEGDTRLQTIITESFVYAKMNKLQEAHAALAQAQKYVADPTRQIPSAVSLELAQAYMLAGEKEKGAQIIKQVISDHHDDEEMLDRVRLVFSETDMRSRGEEIIESTKEEIIMLNNEGVQLVQKGLLTEAIAYFEKAAAKLAENKVINANAAHVLMLHMKEKGTNKKQLSKAKLYLDRVKKIDQNYDDLPALITLYNGLAHKG